MKSKSWLPMCWKCASCIQAPSQEYRGAWEVVGCKENDAIHSYTDAETMCPLIPKVTNEN